jgi:hypothetical protein
MGSSISRDKGVRFSIRTVVVTAVFFGGERDL